MNKHIFSFILFICICAGASGQSPIVRDFMPVCDSLTGYLNENGDVQGRLKLKSVMKRSGALDFYFTETLGDYPWRKESVTQFRMQLKARFPENYSRYKLGKIYSRRVDLDRLVTPELEFDGSPSDTKYRKDNPVRKHPLVKRADMQEFSRGLNGRNIALWQSHGRYFDGNAGEWIWQRPCLFQTVEDMFTQSFVLPYLVPMLENAGAYVMLPRERDVQRNEVIVDYDVIDEAFGRASYEENGRWKDAGEGFAAPRAIYQGVENPFVMGCARKAEAVADGAKGRASAVWTPEIPERGEYAVYISYKSLPESSSAVKYIVHHMGGSSEFIVNQKIGGGTWIYLGTFEFGKGKEGRVSMSNVTPKGYKHESGCVVTADAVKFGGGMGNIARACPANPDEEQEDVENEPVVSGLPRSAEGARYWLQWSGADSTVFSQNDLESDYRDDFMSRGDWVEWISRGSAMNKSKKKGLGIPVDLSFGFHSDAGVTPNDSIVGTLAIYTLRSDNKEALPGGENRMTSRAYADLVQSQIVNDLRKQCDSLWSRRGLWDRGYRESRTPSCPAMLLELLSHQNFADMKYGLDPSFRFIVSRAVYKGMLKYLSNRYDVPYMVQPLPVSHIGVKFGGRDKAVISWRSVEDPLEPTAAATGFILYTRLGDGAFDTGSAIEAVKHEDGSYSIEVPLKAGEIHSYRIEAFNEGGRSFPSETVSIGMPKKAKAERNILIINNFDRISGPAFIDTPTYAGFDNRLDSGVPYIRDIAYVGEMFDYRRDSEYISNINPGFGASYDDYAGRTVAGNTFDYAHVHGKAMMKAGYPFISCSNETFASDSTFALAAWTADLICGKQITTLTGSSDKGKFSVFPLEIQNALRRFTAAGGNVLISGANIATDVWDGIYPVRTDKTFKTGSKKFAREVLGYKWVRNQAGRSGDAVYVKNPQIGTGKKGKVSYHNEINEECYCVESPDGIAPASDKGSTFLKYEDTGISAGVCHEGKGYRTVCLGFPVETLKEEDDINKIISITLDFFSK